MKLDHTGDNSRSRSRLQDSLEFVLSGRHGPVARGHNAWRQTTRHDRHFTLETSVDEILGRGWTDHGETAGITVFHLLTMTSGLDDSLAVVSPPGQRWVYSNAFAQLFDVLTVATGRELDDIARAWLFDPAGATTATFAERRATGSLPWAFVRR